jgi:hypothetical protein
MQIDLPVKEVAAGARSYALFFPPDALVGRVFIFLLIQELSGRGIALGIAFLALDLRLDLRALADRALAGIVASGFVHCHVLASCT